jgi:hypothetical protein
VEHPSKTLAPGDQVRVTGEGLKLGDEVMVRGQRARITHVNEQPHVEGKSMIIGIMGNAGAGKDTIANFLTIAQDFEKISFADPMKRFCRDIFGFSYGQLWGPKEKKETPDPRWDGLTPRKALQLLGTEWGRHCHPDLWIRHAIRTAQTILNDPSLAYCAEAGIVQLLDGPHAKGVAFADCRFVNEFKAIKDAGGKMVRVYRPGYDGDTHRSETEQRSLPDDAFDYVIHNTGTLDDLANKVHEMYTVLVK